MKITYEIKKKQGNFRPKISIKIAVDEWEFRLYPAKVNVLILKADHQWENNDNQKDCTDQESTYTLWTQTEKNESIHEFYLPFRPGKNPTYPEVDVALEELRAKHEAAVLEAYNSIAFKKTGSMEPTEAFKKKIAPWVAKQKMIGGQDE